MRVITTREFGWKTEFNLIEENQRKKQNRVSIRYGFDDRFARQLPVQEIPALLAAPVKPPAKLGDWEILAESTPLEIYFLSNQFKLWIWSFLVSRLALDITNRSNLFKALFQITAVIK